jgi:hypothetical protein
LTAPAPAEEENKFCDACTWWDADTHADPSNNGDICTRATRAIIINDMSAGSDATGGCCLARSYR